MITQEQLKRLLHYNPDTGVFTWRENRRGNLVGGCSAGTRSKGYVRIKIGSQRYSAHQLAWLYMTGAWPTDQLDHINMDRGDNRWANLRAASQSQNFANRRMLATNKTGLKGVFYELDRKKWRAAIFCSGNKTYLGRFDCPAAAHFAYLVASDKFHGEFARAS